MGGEALSSRMPRGLTGDEETLDHIEIITSHLGLWDINLEPGDRVGRGVQNPCPKPCLETQCVSVSGVLIRGPRALVPRGVFREIGGFCFT